MNLKAKITKIAGKELPKGGKGFQLEGEEGWFTAVKSIVPYLDKCKEGDIVNITFEKKGVYRNVTKIEKVQGESKPEVQDAPEFTCEDCGTALKDGKYKKCYKCNQKSNTPPKEDTYKKEDHKSIKEKDNFSAPTTKDVQIRRGNSLAAAGNVLKGNFEGTNTDIETIKQATLELANAFVNWLTLE